MRHTIARFTLLLGALAAFNACAIGPDSGGIAFVTGMVFGADSVPLANTPVVATCHSLIGHGSSTTDAHGHYTMSISSTFPYANGPCRLFAPDSAHAVAEGGALIFFQAVTEDHPVQLIDLTPIAHP